jgi:hypothetical protein
MHQTGRQIADLWVGSDGNPEKCEFKKTEGNRHALNAAVGSGPFDEQQKRSDDRYAEAAGARRKADLQQQRQKTPSAMLQWMPRQGR